MAAQRYINKIRWWNTECPEICSEHGDTIIRRRRDDGRGILRYLAEAAPEQVWQQLSLEQVPINGAP